MEYIAPLLTTEGLIAFLTLASLEVVLGVDNIIFIAIMVGRLPERQRERARLLGIGLAVISRLALLFSITWVMRLTKPLIDLGTFELSGKDLVLVLGGLFLLWKSTREIHHKIKHRMNESTEAGSMATMGAVLVQVVMIDVVFSLDSVITAVGLTPHIAIMVAAVLASVAVMLAMSGYIVRFIDRHPEVKILALSFLIMIGALLVAEGFHQHISKGYVYFAMAFSVLVEGLQIMSERNTTEDKPNVADTR